MSLFVRFKSADPVDSEHVYVRASQVSAVYEYNRRVELKCLSGTITVDGPIEEVVSRLAAAVDEEKRSG